MAKILLELYDGIVNDASIITQQEIDSTVKTPPYYSVPSEISGKSFDQIVSEMNLRGRYSHALRKKDLRASHGKNMEIMIVNGDDPSSFWCKKYDSAKKKFVNVDGESDAERLERIRSKKSKYSIKNSSSNSVLGDEFGYLIPDQASVDSVYGAGVFGEFLKKIASIETLTKKDLSKIDNKLNRLSEPVRCRVIFQIAKALQNDPTPDLAVQEAWWSKLINTELNVRATTELAAIKVRKQDYDAAADLFEYASRVDGVSSGDKAEILERLNGCGRGSELIKNAKSAMDSGDTEKAKKLIAEFKSSATGVVKHLNEELAENMLHICECKEHRKRNDNKMIEKAAKKTLKPYGKKNRTI